MKRRIFTRALILLLVSCLLLSLAACSKAKSKDDDHGDEPSNAEKIIGKWQMVEDDGDIYTWTFSENGRVVNSMYFNMEGSPFSVGDDNTVEFPGTYTVKGDKLTWVDDVFRATTELTIKSLTDSELVLVDEDGKVETYQRVR